MLPVMLFANDMVLWTYTLRIELSYTLSYSIIRIELSYTLSYSINAVAVHFNVTLDAGKWVI